MASDSQLTGDNVVDIRMKKIKLIDGYLVGVAGQAGVIQEFFKWFTENSKNWPLRIPENLKQDEDDYPVFAMVVKNKIWRIDGVGYPYEVTGAYTAIGSGRQIALGAMAMGADAKKAVQIAIKHDIYSSGPIKTIAKI